MKKDATAPHCHTCGGEYTRSGIIHGYKLIFNQGGEEEHESEEEENKSNKEYKSNTHPTQVNS